MIRAIPEKQNALQMASASQREKLDRAIDLHDFANADRVIFPIFSK